MSITIVPFEQANAEFLTGIYCTVGAKGDAATITKRAQTALAVANALSDLATGNIAAASATILASVQSANLDPAMALALSNALQVLFVQWQALQAVNALVPLLSASADALISNFAAGVTAAANAELAKYNAAPKS